MAETVKKESAGSYGSDISGDSSGWAQWQPNTYSPPAYDLDKYYDTNYRRAIAAADQSDFGKMASLGDELLAGSGLGLGSDAWASGINSLNANKRKAYEEASDKNLTQTAALQQQKFNQAIAAGRLNLDTYAQLSSDLSKRIGNLQESARLAQIADAAKVGDVTTMLNILRDWVDSELMQTEAGRQFWASLSEAEKAEHLKMKAARKENLGKAGLAIVGLLASVLTKTPKTAATAFTG
jgi:hypothetical protein